MTAAATMVCMRIAFFGGSFDPPHCGHLAVARAARQSLALDSVLFAPVGQQPLKADGAMASFTDRSNMVRLAIADQPGFELSVVDAPNQTSTPNYTIDTLALLRRTLPVGAKLFLLLGADSLHTLRQWHRAAEIPFAADLIVVSRPGLELFDITAYLPPGIRSVGSSSNRYQLVNSAGQSATLTLLPDVHYDISATQLRLAIRDVSSQPLVPPSVQEYIQQHHLYQ